MFVRVSGKSSKEEDKEMWECDCCFVEAGKGVTSERGWDVSHDSDTQHNTTNGRETHSPTQTNTLLIYIYAIQREVYKCYCVTCFTTHFNSTPSDLSHHCHQRIFCGPSQRIGCTANLSMWLYVRTIKDSCAHLGPAPDFFNYAYNLTKQYFAT